MRGLKATLLVVGLVTVAVAALPMFVRTNGWPGFVDRDGSSRLPNGERIRPVGRLRIPLRGDLPLAMAPSMDGSKCFVVTGGYHDHGIAMVNLDDETTDSYVPTTKLTGGFVAAPDNVYYATAGDLGVRRISISSDKDTWTPVAVDFPKHVWLQGIARMADGTLVVSDLNNDQVYAFDPKSPELKWTAKVGHKPNRVAVDPSSGTIAVTNWGGLSVTLLDGQGQVQKTVTVGAQPSELVFAKDGTLFVSNAGSNTVSVIRDGAVAATVFTCLTPNDLVGSTPTGLALSPDQRTLYVANAGSNNVAQIDVSDRANPKVQGFIPTGWYPTTVFAPADGKRLLIGTGKGMHAAGNYPGIRAEQTISDDLRNHYDYLPNRLDGDVMVVDLPSKSELASWTETCRKNAEREMSAAQLKQEEAMLPTLHKIKHVLYVIRENRTYDQVLGDLSSANGEPRLCMYGEKVTPNGHKIAKTFKTFDNLYCDGEVSQDGHQWCCASYCTDFTEKAWPSGYADRGSGDGDDSLKASPAGYLWDNCQRHGLSYRSYGEFASFSSNKGSAPQFNGESGLAGHASAAWSLNGGRDMDRVNVFIDEMHAAEQDGNWPNFMVMSLGEDHTSGRSPGEYTPFSKVASNDVGLGKMVEAISHSKFWADTAIFVIEDDAQDGPDHIDGHRTVGYVISPYIKRGGVDHTLYSTASMIRTIELILGLPPMTQHDRHATSMVASFTETPNLTPFTHEDARIDLAARNPKSGRLAMESKGLDFSAYDRVEPEVLNRILWEDARPGVPYPVFGHLSR
jgi:DNA-binding beta-propeller fold protein YncE